MVQATSMGKRHNISHLWRPTKPSVTKRSRTPPSNRAQIDNGALERNRLITAWAAAKDDHQALHKKLDDARETSATQQHKMEIDLADARSRVKELERKLADAKSHNQHLDTAALRASEE
jgi:predicted RNase H-like nuclease (RuvC/YqgF family)